MFKEVYSVRDKCGSKYVGLILSNDSLCKFSEIHFEFSCIYAYHRYEEWEWIHQSHS